MNQITIVLPVHPDNSQYVNDVTLPYLDKFFDPDSLHEIIIIQNCDSKVSAFHSTKHKVCVLTDDKICYAFRKWEGPSWRRQQAQKIAISRLVTTQYYLTYDDDVIITKPTCYDDLVCNGKPKLTLERTSEQQSRTNWYTSSAGVLQIQTTTPSIGMAVTPQLLHTEIAVELVFYLEEIYDQQLAEVLLNATTELNKLRTGWTEYTLYWLFVLEVGDGNVPYCKHDLWSEELRICKYKKDSHTFDDEYLNTIFDPTSDYHFAIVSSRMQTIDFIHDMFVDRLPTL